MKNLPVSILVPGAAGAGRRLRQLGKRHDRRDGAPTASRANSRRRSKESSRSRPTSPPTRRTSRTTTRPTARASRARSPTRSPTSSASRQDQVEWTVVPFNSSYAPGPEGLRLRRQPDLDHADAREGRRLLGAVLHGQPGGRRAEGLRRREGDLARRPEGATDRRPDRHHQPRRRQRDDPADARSRRSSTTPTTSSRALKQGQVDAVVVDLPTALYLTAAQVPDATIVGQFAAPGGDQWGALLAKGSPLTACVSGGDRRSCEPPASSQKITERWMSKAAGGAEAAAESRPSRPSRPLGSDMARRLTETAVISDRRAARAQAQAPPAAPRPGDRRDLQRRRPRRAGRARS